MSVSLYQLLDDGLDPQDFLSQLTPPAQRAVLASWAWRARPGQRWSPGSEFVTVYECGRGFGKTTTGSEVLCDATLDPERWGGFALIGGPSPTEVDNVCLGGGTGLYAVSDRRIRAGQMPGVLYRNLNKHIMVFENPTGGGSGLTVRWAASSDPKSFRGSAYGLAWLDEFGVWSHRVRDEQGTNAWEALQPSIRLLPDPKIIITMTPSRTPEIKALQRDAERPPCFVCMERILPMLPEGKWRGEDGQEPWRLPRDPRPKTHPLFGTRSTSPRRRCPVCQTEVLARIRLVTGCSLDNPYLPKQQVSDAKRALASKDPAAMAEWDPQGEVDSAPKGALVHDEMVQRLEVVVGEHHPDRWQGALDQLRAQEVVVFVDPAVTSNEHSDDTGLIVSCVRVLTDPDGVSYRQVVGLQDATVRPMDVRGPPSTVWAPKAYWLALLWGANRIVVETNQGGLEVMREVQTAVANPPTEERIAARLAQDLGRPVLAHNLSPLTLIARRMWQTAMSLRVESLHRAASKPARFGWYGAGAARGEQALACVHWLQGHGQWTAAMAQGTGYEPNSSRKDKKDRFDAVVGAAQVLLGARETKGAVVQTSSWQDPGALYRGL